MAFLARLDDLRQELNNAYFRLARDARDAYATERTAGLLITACARGFLLRARLRRIACAVVTIQRNWRGHLGRLRYHIFLKHRQAAVRQAYFNAQATEVQRHWRGYYSRRYVHDFWARRRYIENALRAGVQLRERGRQEAAAADDTLRAQQEAGSEARMHSRLDASHHLVSTASQAGVLRAPPQRAAGATALVRGVPMEDYIRARHRQQARASPTRGKKCAARTAVLPMQLDLLSTERLGDVQRRSLQSLPHYGRLEAERKVEVAADKRVSRWLHERAFATGAKGAAEALASSADSSRATGAWVPRGDGAAGGVPGRGRLDDGAKKISSALFTETWRPQDEFGRSLELGHGV